MCLDTFWKNFSQTNYIKKSFAFTKKIKAKTKKHSQKVMFEKFGKKYNSTLRKWKMQNTQVGFAEKIKMITHIHKWNKNNKSKKNNTQKKNI